MCSERTDLTRWKLDICEGRQTWRYVESGPVNQTIYEKYFLGLDIGKEAPPLPKPKSVKDATRNAFNFYAKLQTEDGHWADDYGGPLFLMPGLVITCYTMGTGLNQWQKTEMIRYTCSQQHADGGWGLHIEDRSTMFGTALNYVSLRLLGLDKEDPRLQKARAFIHKNGGAVSTPSWGKLWLCTLGVYKWEGLNPVPPELWMLPYFLPMHPGRMWCHCRVVYLPMAWLYGSKSTTKETPLIRSLREELYVEPYDQIKWAQHRNNVCKADTYTTHHWLLDAVNTCFYNYERVHSSWIRQKALDTTFEHIHYEDNETKYICIGPVNKAMDMLCTYHRMGPTHEYVQKHIERIPDYLWLAADGMKMQGYNGSQLWDTAFCLQAMAESGLGNEFQETMKLGYHYLDISQVTYNAPEMEKYYRHVSKGAWPFSTRDHGWPIADCTSEGLKAALLLKKFSFITPLADDRLFDAVNVIMTLQNTDGGWGTYENKRGPDWLEIFNPSEAFHGIMVDYSYPECTGSCLGALGLFRQQYPNHRSAEIESSIQRGIEYIKKAQRTDGSWIGSWGVCFSYAICFVIDAITECGVPVTSPIITKACDYLVARQKPDGGWGESFQSCVQRVWVEHDESQVVNTAWAVMALLKSNYNDKALIKRGIDLLIKRQLPNGDWKQESISGVFNANCAISYSGYKNIWTLWALGRYIETYPDE